MDICAEEMHNSIHSSVALQGDVQGHPNSDMDRKKNIVFKFRWSNRNTLTMAIAAKFVLHLNF